MRSVHQRNDFVGAGYPRPNKLDQNVFSVSGITLCAVIGKLFFIASLKNNLPALEYLLFFSEAVEFEV